MFYFRLLNNGSSKCWSPPVFTAKLQEPQLSVDPTSGQTSEQLPTYNAYSIDGDVTGPIVYVNYGNREDYEQLDRLGISVKGTIVIARYGNGWRGIKPKVAAEHGDRLHHLFRSQRDGYYQGDDYPSGGRRLRFGVQRGSVMDTQYPGDPLTPGVGATADAKRLDIKDAKNYYHPFAPRQQFGRHDSCCCPTGLVVKPSA